MLDYLAFLTFSNLSIASVICTTLTGFWTVVVVIKHYEDLNSKQFYSEMAKTIFYFLGALVVTIMISYLTCYYMEFVLEDIIYLLIKEAVIIYILIFLFTLPFKNRP